MKEGRRKRVRDDVWARVFAAGYERRIAAGSRHTGASQDASSEADTAVAQVRPRHILVEVDP